MANFLHENPQGSPNFTLPNVLNMPNDASLACWALFVNITIFGEFFKKGGAFAPLFGRGLFPVPQIEFAAKVEDEASARKQNVVVQHFPPKSAEFHHLTLSVDWQRGKRSKTEKIIEHTIGWARAIYIDLRIVPGLPRNTLYVITFRAFHVRG